MPIVIKGKDGAPLANYPSLRRTARKLPKEIFERAKVKSLDFLEISITEAKGRFEGEGSGANDKAFASKNWRVAGTPTIKKMEGSDNMISADEKVWCGIRLGASYVPLLEDADGKTQPRIRIDGDEVVGMCEQMRDLVRDLDKDSDDGKIFHDKAVDLALPKNAPSPTVEYAYDQVKDKNGKNKWVLREPTEILNHDKFWKDWKYDADSDTYIAVDSNTPYEVGEQRPRGI